MGWGLRGRNGGLKGKVDGEGSRDKGFGGQGGGVGVGVVRSRR